MTAEAMRAQVEALIEALNARDFDAVAEVDIHPELEFRSIIAATEGSTYRGLEGLKEWTRDVDAVWEGFRNELREFVPAGEDRAVVSMGLTGRGTASGVPLDATTGLVCHWQEGRLRLIDAYSQPADAFAAAEIDPPS